MLDWGHKTRFRTSLCLLAIRQIVQKTEVLVREAQEEDFHAGTKGTVLLAVVSGLKKQTGH